MNGFKRVALYARVSSQKQANEKTITSQCDEIRQRIRDDGCQLVEEHVFCDEGHTGSVLHRPALERLRDWIAASLIDRVYVHSPDRLVRKAAHQALLLEEFRKYDCEIVFLNQPDMGDSAEANLLIQMQGIIAEYEREKILERTRRGRRYSASTGQLSVLGHAPYGYRYVTKMAGGGKAYWEIDPVESEHVRWMFEWMDQRGMTLSAIQRELAARGVSTKKGHAVWDCATIRGILTNSAYFGTAYYGKTRLEARKPGKRPKRGDPAVPHQAKVAVDTDRSEQYPISVPAIVDESVFYRVRTRMDENQKRQRERRSGARYLLSGLLVCGQCGSAYCAHRLGTKYFFYRCIGADKYRRKDRNSICTNTSVMGVDLENLVWSELCTLLTDPSRLRSELTRRRTEHQMPAKELQQRERDVTKWRIAIDRLIDAYTNQQIDRGEFEKRIGPLRERHQREESALANLRGELNDAIDLDLAERALSQLTDDVRSRLASAEYELKRQLLKLLIKRIEIHSDEVQIVYKVPPRPFVTSPASGAVLQHWLSCYK
ncbi:MAG: recombinase family protein [Pirellulales bacterium]